MILGICGLDGQKNLCVASEVANSCRSKWVD